MGSDASGPEQALAGPGGGGGGADPPSDPGTRTQVGEMGGRKCQGQGLRGLRRGTVSFGTVSPSQQHRASRPCGLLHSQKPDPRVLSMHLWLILALEFMRKTPLEGWAVPQEHITSCML